MSRCWRDEHRQVPVWAAACTGTTGSIPMLCSSELLDVVQQHLLPTLALYDLARLACACKSLKSAVYQQSALWVKAASDHLPAKHPPLAPDLDAAAVQGLMQRRLTAATNVLAGRIAGWKDVKGLWGYLGSGDIEWFDFSSDCRLIAFWTCSGDREYQRFTIADACEGHVLWEKEFEEFEASLGTKIYEDTERLRLHILDFAWTQDRECVHAFFTDREQQASPPVVQLFTIDARLGDAGQGWCARLYDDLMCSAVGAGGTVELSGCFSPGALYLGVRSQYRSMDIDLHAISIFDAENGDLILELPSCEDTAADCAWYDLATWSLDASLLVVGTHIFHISNGQIIALDHSPHPAHQTAGFDNLQRWLAVACLSTRDDHSCTSTRFVEADTGALQLEVQRYAFEAWCGTGPHALLRKPSSNLMQVWDVELCRPLRAFAPPLPSDPSPLRVQIPSRYDDDDDDYEPRPRNDYSFQYLLDDRIIACHWRGTRLLLDARSGAQYLELSKAFRERYPGCVHLTYSRPSPDECSYVCMDGDDSYKYGQHGAFPPDRFAIWHLQLV